MNTVNFLTLILLIVRFEIVTNATLFAQSDYDRTKLTIEPYVSGSGEVSAHMIGESMSSASITYNAQIKWVVYQGYRLITKEQFFQLVELNDLSIKCAHDIKVGKQKQIGGIALVGVSAACFFGIGDNKPAAQLISSGATGLAGCYLFVEGGSQRDRKYISFEQAKELAEKYNQKIESKLTK